MRTTAFVFTSLVLVWAVAASPVKKVDADIPVVHGYKDGDKCPAKFFKADCNHCVCSNTGFGAACTKKACPPFVKTAASEAEVPVVYEYQPGQKCPAKIFKDDCNFCSCHDNGFEAACTKMACPPRQKRDTEPVDESQIPVVHGWKAGDKCPAKIFKDDCNYCSCSNDGTMAACTLMACPPVNREKRETEPVDESQIPVVYGWKSGDKCPAKFFKADCNYCSCSNDGTTAACTLMACPPVNNKREKRETEPVDESQIPVVHGWKSGDKCPAKFFKADCNYCSCSNDGTMAACTLMACPEVNNNREKRETEPVTESQVPVVHGYKSGDKCPAEIFKDDCNYCYCGLDGNSAACTLMACPKPQENKEEKKEE